MWWQRYCNLVNVDPKFKCVKVHIAAYCMNNRSTNILQIAIHYKTLKCGMQNVVLLELFHENSLFIN